MKRVRSLLAIAIGLGSLFLSGLIFGDSGVAARVRRDCGDQRSEGPGSVIDAAGSVKSGVSGGFDLRGYRMEMTPAGAPRFVADSPCNGWETRFGTGVGANGEVLAMAVIGSDIYVGGSFTFIGGTPASYIAKYDTVSGTWSALGSGGGNGTTSTVRALAVVGTDLYAGGSFGQVNAGRGVSIFANRVARYDTGTGEWTALATDDGGDGVGHASIIQSSMVNTLAVIGTDLYVGGDFTLANAGGTTAVPAARVAKYDISRRIWSGLGTGGGTGVGAVVRALAVVGGSLYAGGDFTTANEGGTTVAANYVARYNPATSTWSALGAGGGNGTDARVSVLAVSGTDLYLGGQFGLTNVGGASTVAASNVARFATGSQTWSALGTGGGNGVDQAVESLAVSGDNLYIGGAFTIVNNGSMSPVTAYRLARFSISGQTWSPLGGSTENGLNNAVAALLPLGGDLYVGGYFTLANFGGASTVTVNRFARYTLATQTWSAVGSGTGTGSGVNLQVNALAVIGTDLYVGGNFTSVNFGTDSPLPVGYIAKYDTLTGTWSSLGSDGGNGVNNLVNVLLVSGTTLYVGGWFTEVNTGSTSPIQANRIAAYDTVARTWSLMGVTGGNGVDDNVNALAAIGTKLYVGGNFQTANAGATSEVSASYVAQYDTMTRLWSPLSQGDGIGLDAPVYALAAVGTDLYAGGLFSAANQGAVTTLPVSSVARYSPSTQAWSALGTGGGNGVNGAVYALAAGGTTLYVGGSFNSANVGGATVVGARSIAGYNTTTQAWSALGSGGGNGLDNSVSTLLVLGTDLYVGGYFSLANVGATDPVDANGVARYRIGTQSWGAFGSGIGNGVSGQVAALAVLGSGLYAGGFFDSAGGITTVNNLARYNLSAPLTVDSIERVQQALTNSATVQYRVVFSESVSGVLASHFALVANGISGATISSVTGSGTTWTVTVGTGSGTGTLGLNLVGSTGIGNGLGATVCVPKAGEVYRLDRTAPTTVFSSAPPAAASSGTAAFTFTTSDSGGGRVATVECRLDTAAFATCNGTASYTGLSEGSHTFEVRAQDTLGNGNLTPTSYTWTIDTTAPETTISSNPANPSASSSATFAFSGTDTGGSGVASYQCRLDAASFATCTSPTSYTGLTTGSHTFNVRAIDSAGNIDPTPASWTWTVTCPTIDMTSTAIPNGAVSTLYSQTVSATPSGTYSFTVSAGALPTGLTLASGGLISGTPSATGTFSFTIRATDAGGCTGERALTVEIFAVATYEADLVPRAMIDGVLNVSDWVQAGRFVVGLDTTSSTSEFQRTDAAPRSTFGDGKLSVSDWVQTGRYAVGLDPKTIVGGPTTPTATPPNDDSTDSGMASVEAIEDTDESRAARMVAIELETSGEVNGISFTLQFAPTGKPSVELVESLPAGGQLVLNRRREREGLIAVALVLPPGQSLRPGRTRLLTLRFQPAPGIPLPAIVFGDAIVPREVVSPQSRPFANARFRSLQKTIAVE